MDKTVIFENDYYLFTQYIPGLKLNKSIRSPLSGDKKPSFVVYKNDYGHLYYKDFRGGSGDIISFIMNKDELTFKEALLKIEQLLNKANVHDLNILKHNKSIVESRLSTKLEPFNGEIQLSSKLRKGELAYFASYGIEKDLLEEEEVYGVDFFKANTYDFQVRGRVDRPLYLYNYNKYQQYAFKLYGPGVNGNEKIFNAYFTKKERILDGAFNIKTGIKSDKTLLIDSSKKCYMCLRSLGMNNFDVISKQDENISIPEDILQILFKIYPRIINIANNDRFKKVNHGINLAEQFKFNTGIKYIIPPDEYCTNEKITDIADIRRYYGKEKTIEILNRLVDCADI